MNNTLSGDSLLMKKTDAGLLDRMVQSWKRSQENGVFGFTYLLNNRFTIQFYESRDDECRLRGRETFPVDAAQGKEAFEKFLRMHEGPSAEGISWIHLVFRSAGLVRTFSMPEEKGENSEDLLQKRVEQEIPHLVDDVIYHARVQNMTASVGKEGILFGISKTILRDQMGSLEAYGIIPCHVMLSTEILLWRHEEAGKKRQEIGEGVMLEVHRVGEEAELLFFEENCLRYSQWIRPMSGESAPGLELLITAASEAFEKSFGKKAVRLQPEVPDGTLELAAIEAHRTISIFDFSPSDLEARRSHGQTRQLRFGLARSAAWLALAFLVFSLSQLMSSAAGHAWLGSKADPLRESVYQVKQLRRQALAVQKFQAAKVFPLAVIEILSLTMPSELLAITLEYHQPAGTFSLRGEAEGQERLDEFMTALQNQNVLDVSLDRFEAVDAATGQVIVFEISGFFRDGGGS